MSAPPPIRVLEIISGFAIEGPLGGIERFGIELARTLHGGPIAPTVCGMWAYASPYEYDWLANLQASGVAAFIAADWDEAATLRSFWRAYRETRAAVQGQRFDIIHSHCQFGDALALLLKRPLQARALVRTVHNEREWGKRPLRRLLLTNFLLPLRFDVEIGVAQKVVDNLNSRPVARWLGKDAHRIYNSLNLARFDAPPPPDPTLREALSIPAEAAVVGTVGRLSEQKGYSDLLAAAAQVIAQRPNTHFLIVGSGPLGERLQREAHALGIAPHVTFAGPRADVEALLGLMDLFVNSSLWEGLPTVLLEAMAARVPVIATAVGGNTELIMHEKTGVLVPPGSPAHLSSAIVALLAEPPAAVAAHTAAAASFVRANFAIEAAAEQHARLYTSLLGQA